MRLDKLHEDNRGIISLLTEDMPWPEVSVFTTKAGYSRGGCVHHQNDEFTMVIAGEVLYRIGDEYKILKAGDSYKIPKSSPHYFISITESIVLEFGATPSEKQVKHKEFRKIVNNINQKYKEEL